MKIIPNKLVISIILALIIVSYLLILVSNNSNNNNNNKNENSKHNNMYLITNSENSCQKQDELIIVYVFISVLSFERRNLIRNTWSNKNIFPQLKTLFIVGKAPTNKLNEQIAYENLLYGDLIQGNFIETNNKSNTLKSLITWKWISDYCSLANINFIIFFILSITIPFIILFFPTPEIFIVVSLERLQVLFFCQGFEEIFRIQVY